MTDVHDPVRAAFEVLAIEPTPEMLDIVRVAAARAQIDPADLAKEVAAGVLPYFASRESLEGFGGEIHRPSLPPGELAPLDRPLGLVQTRNATTT